MVAKRTFSWSGLAPGFVGVYQLNVVPQAPAVGDVMIACANCSESNHVKVPVVPSNGGDNTSNAAGTVSILFPTGQPTVTFSPAYGVAKITARFDIKPDAGRFSVSVVAKVGSATVDGTTIQFDPVLGTFAANIPSPTQAFRNFDFSSLLPSLTVIDFASCTVTTCLPMPANLVPASRISLGVLPALQSVPLPNTTQNGIHSFYTATGGIRPGSTFTMGGSTNLDLSTFASPGFFARPTGDVPVSVTLYVDGQVVDAATTTYRYPY